MLAERAPERLGINKNIYTIKTRPRLAKVSFKWFCLITEKAIRQDIIVNNIGTKTGFFSPIGKRDIDKKDIIPARRYTSASQFLLIPPRAILQLS